MAAGIREEAASYGCSLDIALTATLAVFLAMPVEARKAVLQWISGLEASRWDKDITPEYAAKILKITADNPDLEPGSSEFLMELFSRKDASVAHGGAAARGRAKDPSDDRRHTKRNSA